MPNHVRNRITAPKGVLGPFIGAGVHERSGEEYQTFDFEQLIPVPEIICQEGTALNVKMIAEIALGLIDFADDSQMPIDPLAPGNMKAATDVLHRSNAIRQLSEGKMAKDLSDEEFEKVVRFMRAYRECGHLDWYDWCVENWGTKWGAYDVNVVSPTVLEFDTAWSAPHKIIEVLAAKTGRGLKHEWADEDTGSNVGHATYHNDGTAEGKELSQTKEGYELCFELRGFTKIEEGLYSYPGDDSYRYRFDGKTYKYEDDD